MASWRVTIFMSQPKIIAYLKPTCGWSNGVRAVLRKYELPFEDRDIINDPAQRQEMIEKLTSTVPLSRLGTTGEIAHAAIFIVENDFFTGRCVDVDGGMRI